MLRIYHAHPDPIRSPLRARTFGPLGRLDPHVRDRHRLPREQPDGRGVNYLAESLDCGLAEAFPEQWPEVAICPNSRAAWAIPDSAVPLLDLTEDGAMYIGAVGTLAWGDEPRTKTQRWARAIYEDLRDYAGIRYRAAHQGGIAIAVWERAGLLRLARRQDYALIDAWIWRRVQSALARQRRTAVRIGANACAKCREAGLA